MAPLRCGSVSFAPPPAGRRRLEGRPKNSTHRGGSPTVSTGVIDSLPDIAAICREHELWFHVDGAYGALAAQVPGTPESLRALSDADSVAVDPHIWLYAPLEAGCALVRDAQKLRRAFSYHPAYYHFDDQVVNHFDYGPQNSRGFRALKVWLALRQVGRAGYLKMIGDDILLARHLHQLLALADVEALPPLLSRLGKRWIPALASLNPIHRSGRVSEVTRAKPRKQGRTARAALTLDERPEKSCGKGCSGALTPHGRLLRAARIRIDFWSGRRAAPPRRRTSGWQGG